MRIVYRSRRAALVAALAEYLPNATVSGISAGVHATVRLPNSVDEPRLRQEARRRGLAFEFLSRHSVGPPDVSTTLLLGYALCSESALRAGAPALAAAIEAVAAP